MKTKQEVTKSVYIRFRVEPEVRRQYLVFCKKNKYIPSKRIRKLIEQDMNINEQ